jgi:hypothetical protein
MGKIIRKLFLSVLSLTLSAIMLGTVTYAWITMTNKNFLDGLVLNVSSGEKLEVSFDGISYYNQLPNDIFSGVFDELIMRDVTSSDGLNFHTGRFGANEKDAIPNIEYATFTLWIRSVGAERNVYLVENVSDLVQYDIGMAGTFVVSRGMQWRADLTFINGTNETEDTVYEGERNTYYASDAVRIAFLEQINGNNPQDNRTVDDLNQVIIDPSGDPLRGYGVLYGALDYSSKRIGRLVEVPVDKPAVVYELTEFPPNNPYVPLNENSKIMELIASDEKDNWDRTYYVGKVTINIWLEGWDADCFDAIMRDEIRIQLKFTAGKSATI